MATSNNKETCRKFVEQAKIRGEQLAKGELCFMQAFCNCVHIGGPSCIFSDTSADEDDIRVLPPDGQNLLN